MRVYFQLWFSCFFCDPQPVAGLGIDKVNPAGVTRNETKPKVYFQFWSFSCYVLVATLKISQKLSRKSFKILPERFFIRFSCDFEAQQADPS